ncbi:alpha/beta fold hydrolase BchO [Tropicibacter sp. S64]|uniref:alpha/beta fold hydrolase BchO n=1 Tax=Tropicibacter sp. S64 TaxID=3415122 RepID=UPI003C7D3627
MDWARDLPDWPSHALSRRVSCPPHAWHVQETGRGPTLLLLHGAGSSTHTWRGIVPLLANRVHLVALDLPGQGFTQAGTRHRLGLNGMTEDIASLCNREGWRPTAIVGHSAGACLALTLSRILVTPEGTPPAVIGINAALGHFDGIAGWLFPVLAKLMALNPLTALAFSAGPGPLRRAERLIAGTGSHLDAEGLRLYARLISDRAHVDGTLRMMASWTIDPLLDSLPEIAARCLLITASGDRAVPPQISAQAARRLRHAQLCKIDGFGHLVHEEAPERIAPLLCDWICAANPDRSLRSGV